MKILYVVLIGLWLSGCGTSPVQTTLPVLATPEQTQTGEPTTMHSTQTLTPTPNSAATKLALFVSTMTAKAINAQATYTERAKPVGTAIANISSTLDRIKNTTDDVTDLNISQAKYVFGPKDGRLAYQPGDIVVTYDTGLSLTNFIVSVRFVNPYDTATTGTWDYGILFRNEYSNDQYRLTILSNRSWSLVNAMTWENIFSMHDQNLTAKAGESNTIWLIVSDAKAYLFINSTYIKTLDVSAKIKAGDISIGIGLYRGNKLAKQSTDYYDFMIWSLP